MKSFSEERYDMPQYDPGGANKQFMTRESEGESHFHLSSDYSRSANLPYYENFDCSAVVMGCPSDANHPPPCRKLPGKKSSKLKKK